MPGPKASANLYDLMARLSSTGVHISPAGAGSLGFLRSHFGDDVTNAHVQEGTGAESSLELLQATDDLIVTDNQADVGKGEGHISPSLDYSLANAGYELHRSGDYVLLRGGDAIFWMKASVPKPAAP